jgi:hypothetical protein
VTSTWTDPANAAETWATDAESLDAGSDNTVWTQKKDGLEDDLTGRTAVVDLYSDIDLQHGILAANEYVEDDETTTMADESLVTVLSPEAAAVLGLAAGGDRATDGELNNSTEGAMDNADWDHVVFENSQYNPAVDINNLAPGDREEFDAADSLPGTFKGVPGTFLCTGDACAIDYRENDADGNHIVTYEGTFRFRPHGAAWVYTPDTDWLAVGVWVTNPANTLGDHEFGAYVYGSELFTAADLTTATGEEVSYNGDVVGRYAENNRGTLGAGRFSATVDLTVDFDTPTNTIQGAMSDFATDGQDRMDWSIRLESAGINADNTFNGQISGLVEEGRGLHGIWNGRFFGNDPDLRDHNRPDFDKEKTRAEAVVTAGNADPDVQAANVAYVTALGAFENQPNAAAGTFAATDRDRTDAYSVTLGGGYVAHNEAPEAPAAE